MGDVEKLLLATIKPALAELSKKGIGLYDAQDEDGVRYIFGGETYLISVAKETD